MLKLSLALWRAEHRVRPMGHPSSQVNVVVNDAADHRLQLGRQLPQLLCYGQRIRRKAQRVLRAILPHSVACFVNPFVVRDAQPAARFLEGLLRAPGQA